MSLLVTFCCTSFLNKVNVWVLKISRARCWVLPGIITTVGWSEENKRLSSNGHKWVISIKEHRGRRYWKIITSKDWERQRWNFIFWTWQDFCTHELITIVVACTGFTPSYHSHIEGGRTEELLPLLRTYGRVMAAWRGSQLSLRVWW